MVHLHQRADPLGGGQAKHRDQLRLSYLVAIERDHLELMPGKSDPVHFRRTRIQDLKENLLAGLYPQRLAEAQHAAIDGGHVVGRVHGTVSAREQRGVPVMQREEDFLVIVPRVVARFDEQKSVLAGVLAAVQIFAGKDVGVIPAKAGGTRGKRVARVAAGRDRRRTLFHGAVHLRGQKEAMPMNHFAVAGLVGHIDGDRLTFFQAQQRTGHLAVIRNGLDVAPRSDFERIGGDVDGVISGSDLLSTSAQRRGSDGHAGQLEQLTPGNQTLS